MIAQLGHYYFSLLIGFAKLKKGAEAPFLIKSKYDYTLLQFTY